MIETLNKLTPDLEDIFTAIENQDSNSVFSEMRNFLVSLNPLGFCACLGMRKTFSSKSIIPPD